MSTLRPIVGKPGKFFDRSTGEVVTLTEARETDRFDTAEQTSGAITAGDAMNYFRDLTNKNDVDHNIPEAGKLVTGSERLILERLGLAIQPANGTVIATPKDIKRFVAHGFLEFKLNKFVVEDGPLEKFPPGYGLWGMSNENEGGIVGIGVPSTAAQVKFQEQQVITDQHTVKASITFYARSWLTTSTLPTLDSDVVARLYCHGILESAATNN